MRPFYLLSHPSRAHLSSAEISRLSVTRYAPPIRLNSVSSPSVHSLTAWPFSDSSLYVQKYGFMESRGLRRWWGGQDGVGCPGASFSAIDATRAAHERHFASSSRSIVLSVSAFCPSPCSQLTTITRFPTFRGAILPIIRLERFISFLLLRASDV